MNKMSKNDSNYKKKYFKNFFLIIVSGFVGYLFGYADNHKILLNNDYKNYFSNEETNYQNIKLFSENFSKENIQRHLKYLTSIPHLAGTDGDRISAEYMEKEWKEQGLDSVQRTSYDVYLDYPDDYKYNNIKIINSDLTVDKLYEIKEKPLDSNENYDKISKPFLAYSINGSFTFSEIYFLNYCSESDFQLFLKLTGKVNLNGHICLCKYGRVFRGNKVRTAEKYGAKSVLLYDDPYRGAPLINNMTNPNIYPNGECMPEYGTQRGTINVHEGDPLTPTYPSIESAYQISEPELPKIAAQVIGYQIAKDLFQLIDHKSILSPLSWHGQMNVRYSLGGKLKNNKQITLNVFNQKDIKKIHNVGAVIEGVIEPDRYIIVGNHRDSWTYGSMDPTFGTAILLEISRMLNDHRKINKWMPRRTILFQSWSAEEYGLIGSTEWVEEFEKKLSANSVIYINLDVSVYGNFSYEAMASPLLYDMLYDITKHIHIDDKETVYSRWLMNNPDEETKLPYINPYLGSGSDHMAFLQRAGIPCVDQKYGRKKSDILSKRMGSSYPLYHTSYETYKLITDYIDPNFTGSKLLTTIVTEIARTMSSSHLLPFNTDTYAYILQREYKKFKSSYQEKFDSFDISLESLEYAVRNFSVNSQRFMNRIKTINLNDDNLVRQYNEQFRSLERAFLDYNSLKKRGYMHMIFAPSILDKYTSEVFPSLTDIINDNENQKLGEEIVREKIKYELSVVIYAIQSACAILKEPTDFQRYVKY